MCKSIVKQMHCNKHFFFYILYKIYILQIKLDSKITRESKPYVCSKFEVEIKKIQVPGRFFAFSCHKLLHICHISLLLHNCCQIWNLESQTFPCFVNIRKIW